MCHHRLCRCHLERANAIRLCDRTMPRQVSDSRLGVAPQPWICLWCFLLDLLCCFWWRTDRRICLLLQHWPHEQSVVVFSQDLCSRWQLVWGSFWDIWVFWKVHGTWIWCVHICGRCVGAWSDPSLQGSLCWPQKSRSAATALVCTYHRFSRLKK